MPDIEEMIDQLTAAVQGNQAASDALMVLVSELVISKATISQQARALRRYEETDLDMLNTFLNRVDSVLQGMDRSNDILRASTENLQTALSSINDAEDKMRDVLAEYSSFRANTEALGENLKNVAGGILKATLGPASSMPPLNGVISGLLG